MSSRTAAAPREFFCKLLQPRIAALGFLPRVCQLRCERFPVRIAALCGFMSRR